MDMNIILVLDIGTSNVRGILFNEKGKIVYKKSIENLPEYKTEKIVEHQPEKYRKKITDLVMKCGSYIKENNYRLSCISTTALRTCVMLVMEDGTPVSDIIMWQDRRAEKICQDLRKKESLVYNHTGTKVHPVFVGPKAAWLRENKREDFERADKIVTVVDDIHHMLTGKWVTDITYGSRTSLMNIRTLTWDKEMLSLFGVNEEKLCKLVEQGSVIGTVTPEFAEKTGIPVGIPVVSAGGDQNCGALGAGVTGKGMAQLTTGSGSYLIASADKPLLDKKRRFLCNVSAVKGHYIVEASMLSSAILYEWFYKNFYGGSMKQMAETINVEAEHSQVGANGMLALPYFQGRGCPDWNTSATGSFLNITMHNNRGDFARALLEGISMESAENLEIIEAAVGPLEKIYLGGGLTKSNLFCQIQADTLLRNVLVSDNTETTALGAFIQAAVAMGWIHSYQEGMKFRKDHSELVKPNFDNGKKYQEVKARRKKLYKALYEKNEENTTG